MKNPETPRWRLARLTRPDAGGTEWRICRGCAQPPRYLLIQVPGEDTQVWSCPRCGWEVRL